MISPSPRTPLRFLSRPNFVLPVLGCALLGATSLDSAQAQNLPRNDPQHGAGQTTSVAGTSVTVRPGRRSYVTRDLRTAVVGATHGGGDVAMARRGMASAYAAISILPGYTNVAAGEVSSAMQDVKADTLRVPEYLHLKKQLKAERALSITLTPGEASDASVTYTAVAELIDLTSGGLVGRGEDTFTATPDNANPARVAESTVPPSDVARGALIDGPTGTLAERAVDGAVARAVFKLNTPILTRGVVLNKSARADIKGGAHLTARVSLGEFSGMRVGTPVEYLTPGGQSIGFGTIIDLAAGEALATVAPEAAYSNLYVNCEVRNLDNPPLSRAGATQRNNDDREWKSFETKFGIALVGALAISLIYF